MTLLDISTAGWLLRPDDRGWDDAREAFNTTLDLRPAAIAHPADEVEVAAAVTWARSQGLRIAPQSTGHGAGPLEGLADTVVINTSRLDGVSIDAAARRVRVGAGVKWERVVPELSDLGLAALHGSSSDVGIAGYSLGGGMGWLARRHGLQANSVTAIEIVTADGHLLRTDANHEPDLFWALRGGGGNFGVVTAIEFTVYPVPELYAGTLFFPFERSADVLHTWHDLLPTLPDEMMSWVTLLHFADDPALPSEMRGGSFAIVMAAYLGGASHGRELLRPLHDLGPVVDTFDTVPPSALGPLALEDPAEPIPFQTAHDLLDPLPPDVIDALLAVAGPGAEAPPTMVQLRHMGGAMSRRTAGAGSRATLPGTVSLFSLTMVDDPADVPAVRDALDAVHAVVADHRVGQYGNLVERPADAATFFDASTWNRLRDVKAVYDPEDLFRGQHHVPPSR